MASLHSVACVRPSAATFRAFFPDAPKKSVRWRYHLRPVPNSISGRSHEITIGTTRFSPGFKVKRTAIAPARVSPLLIHLKSLLERRPSFEKELQTWSP